MRSTLVRRAAAVLAASGAIVVGGAVMAVAHAAVIPPTAGPPIAGPPIAEPLQPPAMGPLQQSTSLLGVLQQTEQSKAGTWALTSTVVEPQGMMIGSPVSAYGQTAHGSFGCFLFVCQAHATSTH